jgi:hypothetical protein
MRSIAVVVVVIFTAIAVDYGVTEGFYTAKFIEMSQKIGRSFVR